MLDFLVKQSGTSACFEVRTFGTFSSSSLIIGLIFSLQESILVIYIFQNVSISCRFSKLLAYVGNFII